MELQEAILHRIIKLENTAGPGSATVVPRTERLAIDEYLQQTSENVLRIYGKTINGFGTFDPNRVRYQYPVLLENYFVNNGDFILFSQDTAGLIAAEMSNANFANGGYALFLRYTNVGADWLLLVMLKLKAGTGIDPVTLTLNQTLSFDIDHLHEAARIDLMKWQANTQPYLSFIKKRTASEDVTRYFRQALGCTEYTDSKQQTTAVMKAVDDFCEAEGWSGEQRRDARRRTFEYCEARDRAEEPVNLVALSAHIYDQQPASFIEFIRENDYQVSETFKPHRTTYTRFKRIDGKVGNVKISFDVEDLVQQRVDYDEEKNCLIINNISSDLVDKIKKIKPDAAAD